MKQKKKKKIKNCCVKNLYADKYRPENGNDGGLNDKEKIQIFKLWCGYSNLLMQT